MPNKADDVTARLTDTSKYTGAHKERFNKDGTGKGQAGRKDLFNNTGNTSSNTRDNTIQGVTIEKKGAVVNPVDNFGSTAKKVLWFEYAKKNDQGEKFVLTKQKFPTMKQISAATVKFTPPGKPKQIYDKNLKEVKTLEEFEDGGKYLVMTAFDKQKLDETKIPTAFRG